MLWYCITDGMVVIMYDYDNEQLRYSVCRYMWLAGTRLKSLKKSTSLIISCLYTHSCYHGKLEPCAFWKPVKHQIMHTQRSSDMSDFTSTTLHILADYKTVCDLCGISLSLLQQGHCKDTHTHDLWGLIDFCYFFKYLSNGLRVFFHYILFLL